MLRHTWPRAAGAMLAAVAIGVFVTPADLRAQTTAVPLPFPGAGAPPAGTSRPSGSPAASPAATPVDRVGATAPDSGAAAPARDVSPDASLTGVQIYPTAEFLAALDAGSNQRYFLYGTNASFTDIVTYYRTVLKSGGRELSKAPGPAIAQFDLGKFQDATMAYPPSVVIKDYTWNGQQGYLFVNGTTEKRFKTIIQIVPAAVSAK